MRKFILTCVFVFLFFTYPKNIFAGQSTYVLPYPGTMPGSIFYKPRVLLDSLLSFWYFGNLSQFKFNLGQSDKYLVQAKTLFEYKQYLLGYNSLVQSDEYFKKAIQFLQKAKKENKDTSQKQELLKSASLKHQEELLKLEKEIPQTVVWTPEKSNSTTLSLKEKLLTSFKIRKIK